MRRRLGWAAVVAGATILGGDTELRAQSSGATTGTAGTAATAGTAGTAPDTAQAIEVLNDLAAACQADAGRLWSISLCGPMVLVDRATRTAVANQAPPVPGFVESGGAWVGRFPDAIYPANTAFDWVGQEWAMAVLPLSRTRFGRLQLVLHEAFHRIQDEAGITALDLSSPHLDERDGRYWLRLELRALATAVESDGEAARSAARDALLFRAARHATYPGADTLEAALELAEGMAEYTGIRIAGDHLGRTVPEAASRTRAFERRPAYTRALGYGTGPALGLLLDRWSEGWQRSVSAEPLASRLAQSLTFVAPARPAAAAARRAGAYGGAEIAAEEDARAAQRAGQIADYRRRLLDGPVVLLEQQNLMRGFDPNTLVPFPGGSTVYPTGNFSSDWGTLNVESGGALLTADYGELRIEAPADFSGSTIRGPGWVLELSAGWKLVRGSDGVIRAAR